MVDQRKTNRVIKQLTYAVPIAGKGSEALILPNNSGDNIKGFVNKAPVKDHDFTNKKYVDDSISDATGIILVVTANPATGETGQMILNTSNHSIYIWYLGEWRLLHTITVTEEYLLLETGDYILQENGDLIIR